MRAVVAALLLTVPLGPAAAATIRMAAQTVGGEHQLVVSGLSRHAVLSDAGGVVTITDGHRLRLAGAAPAVVGLAGISVDPHAITLVPGAGQVVFGRWVSGRLVVGVEAPAVVPPAGASAHERAPAASASASTVSLSTATETKKTPTRHATPPAETLDGGKSGNGGALVPGLPAPFLAVVEGQVTRSLSAASASSAAPSTVGPTGAAAATVAAVGPTNAPSSPVQADHPPGEYRLPFAPDSGVAIRRRGGEIMIVVAGSPTGDMPPLASDPAVLSASFVRGEASVRIVLRERRPGGIGLVRRDGAWWLLAHDTAHATSSITLQAGTAGLRMLAGRPGRAVVVDDPDTGEPLLVGAVLASGEDFPSARRSALFALDRTVAGVMVEPLSEHLVLRRSASGFVLCTDDGSSLHLPADFVAPRHAADTFSRLVDLPSGSIPALTRRFTVDLQTAAGTPLRERFAPRLAAVRTLVSLGLGREAGTILDVALADRPDMLADRRVRLLRRMIAVIDPAGPIAATGPSPVPLGERMTDDERLWGVLAALRAPSSGSAGPSPEERARVFRSMLELLLSYPAPLVRQTLAPASAILLAGGTPDDLVALERLPDGTGSRVPKAMALGLARRPNDEIHALAGLERDRDPFVRAEALRQDVALRVRLDRLAPGAGADLLAAHRLDWRLTGQAMPVLLQEADLRLEARQFETAFALWRGAMAADPASRAAVSVAIGAGLARMCDARDAAAVPPAQFITITDEEGDLIRSDPALAARVATLRADKFEALALFGRAADTLDGVATSMTPGDERGAVELRAAELRLQDGDTTRAAASLDRARADGWPAALASRAARARARLLMASGQDMAALAALPSADGDRATVSLRATLDEALGRWPDAEAALAGAVAQLTPAGPLSDPDVGLVLRLATADARAHDGAALRSVVRRFAPRLPDPGDRSVLARLGDAAGGSAPPDRQGTRQIADLR